MTAKRSKKKKAKRRMTVKKRPSSIATHIEQLLNKHKSVVLKVIRTHQTSQFIVNRTRCLQKNGYAHWAYGTSGTASPNSGVCCWYRREDSLRANIKRMLAYDKSDGLKIISAEVNRIPVAIFK